MKKIYLLLFFYCFCGFAQQFTVTDIFNYSNNVERRANGYYYKDVTGYLDQFIGTWQCQNGTTTYTLQFKKSAFIEDFPHVNKTYQKDYLIGALKVVKNGVMQYNDLPTLNQYLSKATDYNIYSIIRVENFNDCYMCTYPSQRLYLKYDEPGNDNYAFVDLGFIMHTYTQNGVTKLRMEFRADQVFTENFVNNIDLVSPPNKTSLHMGYGTFDFVKIP